MTANKVDRWSKTLYNFAYSVPRSTTPAEDDGGETGAEKGETETPRTGPAKARWAADGRRFAPWHYTEEAMMHDAAGRLHHTGGGQGTPPHGPAPLHPGGFRRRPGQAPDAGQRLALGGGTPPPGDGPRPDTVSGIPGAGAWKVHHAVDGGAVRRPPRPKNSKPQTLKPKPST